MTSDPATEALPLTEKQIPSTAGMTTKVVKGSMWTLAGQVVPLLATLVTTPFVIRLLGSESYGVLLLVGLIPNYFTFADFGMGMASTKFASEAYGRGDHEGEAQVVRTAALIAFLCASSIALPMIVLARPIVAALNVADHLLSEAAIALQLTAISFVAAILSNVFNTPQLARLRMDLNAAINATGRVILAFGTVAVLYLGGGIAGAAAFGLGIALLVLVLHLIVSSRLIGKGFGIKVSYELALPMLRFGGGLLISGIAGILLVNSEKLLLTKLVSVQALAYYSVAFTFANMATMVSVSMIQPLVPAFAQLLGTDRRDKFDSLFSTCIRLNVIWLPLLMMSLFVIAEPFFNLWAGDEFGKASTLPFYVLLFGLFFNLLAYVPYTTVLAVGRTDVFAKLYAAELAVSIPLTYFLVGSYGIVGAAISWSVRVFIDTFIVIFLAKRIAGVHFEVRKNFGNLVFGLVFVSPPILFSLLIESRSFWIIPIAIVTISIYSIIAWTTLIKSEEKLWLISRLRWN